MELVAYTTVLVLAPIVAVEFVLVCNYVALRQKS